MKAILIGFMGSGKTTIGKLLAHQLALPHIDLDDQIIAAAGCPITNIFEQHGEDYFRQLEHQLLLETLTRDGVLSTGGGTPAQATNLQVLQETATPVILLEAAADTILERVHNNHDRPLVNSLTKTDLVSLKDARRSQYHTCADLIIQTDGLSPQTIVKRILSFLKQK
ncbi:shikimate kinase [Liquorilactobacillus capillatus]|uniref:Shikimate kinase n=1 Tax=Liquorilactobacillus capillatus DSM 19910 TaxID=1423731 RepID=A0A0R1LYV9_9LACO|nr:shikimate kinase [Liquorilactobacillus capillatus]KRL00861.1 shikimate kinase [Liquorilactobacillus capillatus DSM 19910]